MVRLPEKPLMMAIQGIIETDPTKPDDAMSAEDLIIRLHQLNVQQHEGLSVKLVSSAIMAVFAEKDTAGASVPRCGL